MRVLYFTRRYTPHDHRFLSGLVKSKHQVYALFLERNGTTLEDRPLPPEINLVHWKGGQAPARWQDGLVLLGSLREVLRSVKPDVVHAGTIQTAAFLTALAGYRPLVSMSWGSDLLVDANRNPWWNWATRFTLRRSSILLADCETVGRKALELGFPYNRQVFFPWGVDLDHFSPAASNGAVAAEGWESAFVLLSLRSWEPIYGVDVLVRAFCRAAQQAPELRLLLLGNGSQAGLIRQILIQNDMLERVWYVGQVKNSDLPRYYRMADLYVSASHSDGSSVSLLEAMACGRPVLVSDIPSNQEWVQPGENGWLFRDNDPAALADGILSALAQRQSLASVGQVGRRVAEARADWSKNFQKLLDAYEMAAANA